MSRGGHTMLQLGCYPKPPRTGTPARGASCYWTRRATARSQRLSQPRSRGLRRVDVPVYASGRCQPDVGLPMLTQCFRTNDAVVRGFRSGPQRGQVASMPTLCYCCGHGGRYAAQSPRAGQGSDGATRGSQRGYGQSNHRGAGTLARVAGSLLGVVMPALARCAPREEGSNDSG